MSVSIRWLKMLMRMMTVRMAAMDTLTAQQKPVRMKTKLVCQDRRLLAMVATLTEMLGVLSVPLAEQSKNMPILEHKQPMLLRW
jgi:hypothetical protein